MPRSLPSTRARPFKWAVVAVLSGAALLPTGCKDGAPEAGGAQAGARGGRGAAMQMAQQESVPVETAQVTRGPISAFLTFNSTLESEAAVDIFPQIGGQIEEIMVEEGQRVEAGQPLLRIDDREVAVDLRDSENNLRHIEQSFARNQEMFNRGLLNQQEFDNQKFQLEQARLRFERERIRMEYTTVKAPFSGVLASRDVQLGARVGTGTKLFTLVSLDEIVARVHVPGRYLPAIEENQSAFIASEFLPDARFNAWVKRISPVIDPQSGTFGVTVGVRDVAEMLRPGLFVNVQIVTETRADALLVPKRALVYEGGQRYIFAVIDGRAVKRPLVAGFEDSQNVEAVSGLESGAQVIVLGQNGLRDGSPVRVVAGQPNGSAATTVSIPALADRDS